MTRNLREDEIVSGRSAQQKRAMMDHAKAQADAFLERFCATAPNQFPSEIITEVTKDEVWQAEYDDQLDEAIEEFEAKQLEKEDAGS